MRFVPALAIVMLAAFAPPIASAAAESAPEFHDAPDATVGAYDPERHFDSAPVVVDGRTLFRVRGISARPAPDRAAAIAGRIRGLAADPTVDPAQLSVSDTELGTTIGVGKRLVMSVNDADAELEGVERHVLASAYRDAAAAAIVEWRAARTPERTGAAVGRSAVAVAVLAAVLGALLLGTGAAGRAIERRLAGRVRDVGIQSVSVISAQTIWKVVRSVVRLAALAAVLAAVYVCAWYVLNAFPDTRAAAHRLGDLALAPLGRAGEALADALPGLLFLVVLAFVTRWVLRFVQLLFLQVERGNVAFDRFEPEWAMPTYRIVRVVVVAFALVVAYPYIPGSDSDAFKGVSLFLGVMFSLGSTSFIANVIAGYSMTYRRAFRVGDVIRVDDVTGTVTDARLQVTHLRNVRNEEIVVPNSQLLQATIVNYSSLGRETGIGIVVEVGIGYETPWRQVEAMLLLAAERAAGFLAEPRPFVRQTKLGDFAVTYELHAFTRRVGERLALQTELHRNVLDVFNEYGVQIMTPAYEGDPEVPKLVPKEQWYAAPGTAVTPVVSGPDPEPVVRDRGPGARARDAAPVVEPPAAR